MDLVKSLKKTVKNLPRQCGVYIMKDAGNRPVYIGKAKNLKSRVQSYFSNDKSFKNTFLIPRIHRIDYILTDTEVEAYLLEASLVKKHKPRYNVRLKDDKSYPYIRCSMEDNFPRFHIERRVKKKGSLYFGPYTDAGFVRQMIQFLNQQFKIRDCSNHFMKGRVKPCLTYHIGDCSAPCVDKVSQKNYLQQVKKSLEFLRGKGKILLKSMEEEMKKLSEEERFEEATRLRDRIKAIEFCRAKQSVVSQKQKNMDVIAFHREEKAILFQTLHVRSGVIVGHRFYYYDFPVSSNLLQRHKMKKVFSHKSTLPETASNKIKSLGEDHLLFGLIAQYYIDNLLPELLLLSVEQIGKDMLTLLEQILFKISGKSVCIRAPKGSVEKKLMNMTLKNAYTRFKEQYSKNQSLWEALGDIQKKFHLKNLPERIECFDISHFQGKNQVASQVVFEGGVPKKEDYRRYKIQTVKGVDDFSAIKEVLDRRFRHTEHADPHLLVVDGGKGQLQQALLALKEAGREEIPVVAMAKARVKSDFSSGDVKSGKERFFIPKRKNAIVLPAHSESLKILMYLRDEAHRFAITYHRRLSQKSFFS